MKPWKERPKEVANLLNPAFCSSILNSSVLGYNQVNKKDMPLPILFMVLPIILHEPTRNALPNRVNKSLVTWIKENNSIRMLFHERVISLKPFTEEALMFSILHNWLSISKEGNIKSLKKQKDMRINLKESEENLYGFIKRSQFLGRWFASIDAPQTIMALWGIRP